MKKRASTWSQMGFLRVAVASPEHRVADVAFNLQKIKILLKQVASSGGQLLLLPELSLTGYSCGDLFYQNALLSSGVAALNSIAEATSQIPIIVVVGLPISIHARLYNCAAVVCDGKVIGLVPKIHLPNTQEFYEERWFTSGRLLDQYEVQINERMVPVGTDLLFQASNMPDCLLGIEICEDLWAVQPPSGSQALAGATVILNPSASNETLGKSLYRRSLVGQQSARTLSSYLYVSAGPGESSSETVYSGHGIIAENGMILAESERFSFESQLTVADLDLQRLQNDRLKNSSFSSDSPSAARTWRTVPFVLPMPPNKLRRFVSPAPFVPIDKEQRAEHCLEIFSIQTTGLEKRLRYTGLKRVVLGISGGLDSTLALLVIVGVFDRLNLPRKDILTVTLPGLGTTSRTRNNAERLAKLFNTESKVISIETAVRQHFADISHPEELHDIVFENSQARERTQILMDLANQIKGLVVGTGDLSEAALGWCTFNADQMSMYHVNVGIPKTLVKYLIEWAAEGVFQGDTSDVLKDIIATPISPELLPLNKKGMLKQKTEESVGPYELHDFFLYYFVRHQFSPDKILYLAEQAFQGRYSAPILKKWLDLFHNRFIRQQFKRSSLPDGPKVGSVALSPRSDWRMPSDADFTGI